MNQGIYLIFLQCINLGLSVFVNIYFLYKVNPIEYSLIAIYAIITSTTSVFTCLNIETFCIRNFLFFLNKGNKKKIKYYFGLSLYSRFLTFAIVFPFLLIYSYYVSEEKYEGKYIYLFILFSISSLLSGLNESFRLLTLAFNKYATASFVDTISGTLAKCVGIFLMISSGIKAYILCIIIFSIFSLICYIIVNKEWIINPFCFSFRALRGELKELKAFTYSGYLRFINSTLDQLLISIVLSPGILSTYSLSRNILAIANTTMFNLIDYKVQKLVKYKNNRLNLIKGIHKLVDFQKNLTLTAVISLLLVIIFIFFINESGFLTLNIKYPYFYFSLIFACIGGFIIVNYKLYQSFTGMFLSSTLLLKIDIQRAILYLFSFLSIAFFLQERWIFLYLAFYNAIDFIIYKKYFIMEEIDIFCHEICFERR